MPPAYEILLLNTTIPQIQAAQSGDTYVVPRAIAFNAGVNVVNNDVTIYGVTVGRGAGGIASNTAVGYSALGANTSGSLNTAVGYQAGAANTTAAGLTLLGYQTGLAATAGNITAVGYQALLANTAGLYNTAIGQLALQANTTASNNTAVGYQAGYSNTVGTGNVYFGWLAGYAATSSTNTFIGAQSGYNNTTGERNTYIGNSAGFNATTGSNNTFIGLSATSASGAAITTGSKNTLLGGYNGNQGGLDIRTANNYIVLSDGDGNPLVSTYANGTTALQGAVPNNGTGITFPATQSASSNANTLDDYEEGTWTPTNAGDATGTIANAVGEYVKVGRLVYLRGFFSVTANFTGANIGGLPFTPSGNTANTSLGPCNIVINQAAANLACAINIDLQCLSFYTDNDVDNVGGLNTTNLAYRFSITYQASA